MAALFWKEWRENQYKVGVGLGICVILLALRGPSDKFNAAFADVVQVWATAIGVLTAGVLGMEVVAGERSRGTIDFLLTRPTTPARILGPKFAAGAVGLLAVVAGFWLMVYAVPFNSGEDGTLANWVIADVPWAAMVLVWYLPLLAAYSYVFFASAVTDNPAEAGALGAILALGTLYVYVVLGKLIPEIDAWGLPEFMLGLGVKATGSTVRVATTWTLLALRFALSGAIVAATCSASLLAFSRHRQYSVRRSSIVVAGFALVAGALILPPLLPEDHASRSPRVEVPLSASGKGLLLLPQAGEGVFAAVTAAGLQVFSTGPLADWPPVARGAVSAPGSVEAGVVASGRVWLAAEDTGPDGGIAVVSVAVDDADAPRVLATSAVAGFHGSPDIIALDTLDDQALVLAARDDQGLHIAALQALETGAVSELSRLLVSEEDPLDTGPWPELEAGTRRWSVTAYAGCLYLGMSRELVIVDARDPRQLVETSRLPLEAPKRDRPHGPRHMTVANGILHVERRWPGELVSLDLTDPAAPVLTGTAHRNSPLNGGHLFHGLVLRPGSSRFWGRGMEVRDPEDLEARPIHVLFTGPSERGWGLPEGRPLLLRDHLLFTVKDKLAVFHLPERLQAAAARAN